MPLIGTTMWKSGLTNILTFLSRVCNLSFKLQSTVLYSRSRCRAMPPKHLAATFFFFLMKWLSSMCLVLTHGDGTPLSEAVQCCEVGLCKNSAQKSDTASFDVCQRAACHFRCVRSAFADIFWLSFGGATAYTHDHKSCTLRSRDCMLHERASYSRVQLKKKKKKRQLVTMAYGP